MTNFAKTNVPVEFPLKAERAYSDIFDEIEVDVIYQGPDGGEWRVPAFWAGDNIFRVRFAAPSPGRYSYRSICSNPDDAGLHGQTGEIVVEPYEGPGDLFQHGRLRVAESRRTLEHADGTPFLWMGDTWWMGLVKRFDWPDGVRSLVADRVAKGFNLIQIVAGPLPDFDAEDATWHPQQANEAGWPWEKDWTRINPRFYDLADLRIAYLVENGLVPCIVGMWGFYLPLMGVRKAKQHWRNLVARYGAYPVIWCAAGEVKMPTYSRHRIPGAWESEGAALAEGWTEVTRCIRECDPYHNPITAHPTCPSDSREMLLDETLLDIDMLQTGHSGHYSLRPSAELVNAAVARHPRMPVVNGEACYEGSMGGSWQEVQRFLFWTSMTSGAAGHTYGAQGIWAMSSRDEPFAGSTMSWGDTFWQDAMHLPGSAHVGLGRRFFERYPWWLFEPRLEPEVEKLGRISAFATGIPGTVAIFYLPASCTEPALAGVKGARVSIEPGVTYIASFFNPRTGAEIEIGLVKSDADGKWPVPRMPSMEDWILVLEDREALARIA